MEEDILLEKRMGADLSKRLGDAFFDFLRCQKEKGNFVSCGRASFYGIACFVGAFLSDGVQQHNWSKEEALADFKELLSMTFKKGLEIGLNEKKKENENDSK